MSTIMNEQITINSLLENFRRHGVIRRQPSFFGKLIGASYAEKMLNKYAAGGLTLPEPNFFGAPIGAYAKRQQPPQSATVSGHIFMLPTHTPVGLPRAA